MENVYDHLQIGMPLRKSQKPKGEVNLCQF